MYFLDARRQNISPAGRNNNAIEELLKSPQCLRPTLPFSDRKSANTDTRQQNYNLVTPRNAPLEMFHCHTDDRMNVNTTLTRYRLSPHPPAPSLPPDTCSHWTGVNTLVKRLSNVATRSLLHFHLIHVDTNTNNSRRSRRSIRIWNNVITSFLTPMIFGGLSEIILRLYFFRHQNVNFLPEHRNPEHP